MASGVESFQTVQSEGAILLHARTSGEDTSYFTGYAVDSREQNKKDKKPSDVVLNEAAIIAEIERMGQGLIKSITVYHK